MVTDHDIREPGMLELTEANCSEVSLTSLSEGMELHLHVHTKHSAALHLAINHNSCVASYSLEEIKDDGALHLDPKRREFYCIP